MTLRRQIGVDWGSSSLRVFDLEPELPLLLHGADLGIKRIKDGRFAEVLDTALSDLGIEVADVTLSGMITSRHGWVETPYAPVPATAGDIAGAAITQQFHDRRLTFLPGIRTDDQIPDVARGEEVEAVGIFAHHDLDDATIVLPGTHSKWVEVSGRAITGFTTHVTGELYELIRQGSLLSATKGVDDDAAEELFTEGVLLGFDGDRESGGLLHTLFSVRSRALFSSGAGGLAGYLSGILIGSELRGALARPTNAPLVLAGDGELPGRYWSAMATLGVHAERVTGPLAALGMQHINNLQEH
ncbi:MAG: 2-dehydro-3-deoxygalactonokinase [Rhodoglobus sp.]